MHMHTTDSGRRVYYLDTSYTLRHQNNRDHQVQHLQVVYMCENNNSQGLLLLPLYLQWIEND